MSRVEQHSVQAILLMLGALGIVMLFAVGECFRELQLADAYTLFFAPPLVITLLSGPMLQEPAGPARVLAPEHWLQILLLGTTGVFGQVLLTAAFRRATVAIVAPFDYTRMIWAVVYGLVFWGYLPGWWVWVGAAIIVASGLFILLREHSSQRRRARSADTFRDGFSA